MAQEVKLMGAIYSDVSSVKLPDANDDLHSFTDCSVVTATASDVAQGKVFVASDGTITTGTASGGGGASNTVTGTFKGTTAGQVLDIPLNYVGTGYPVAVVIAPLEGSYNPNGTFYNAIQRYAFGGYYLFKCVYDTAPTYASTGTENNATAVYRFKASATSATSYSQSPANNITFYKDENPSGAGSKALRLRSATRMSVYIASSSYGFMANIDYFYTVIYSE